MKLSSIAAELRRRWPDCVMRLESPECDLNGIHAGKWQFRNGQDASCLPERLGGDRRLLCCR